MPVQITDWPRHKQDEVATVIRYLENEGISFKMSLENLDVAADEPTDVWVRDINKRFQVVASNFELWERLGKAKPDENGVKVIESGGNRADVWRQNILEPLEKKRKYGPAAKGNVLLIRPPFDPPWVETDVAKMRASGYHHALSSLCFDAIYVVLHSKNLLLYP